MRSFENWTAEELELTFGLKEVENMPFLTEWLEAKFTPNQRELENLQELQSLLKKNAASWNEDEVKIFFIGPLVVLVNFTGENYKPFTQRPLSATLNDLDGHEIEIGGKVDLMVATGKEDPRQPFFFIHEYKQEKRRETDPKGQLLASMLAARIKNGLDFPILGSYVIGRLWFFVVLDGYDYSYSLAFDASRDAIFEVFSILRFAQKRIAEDAKRFIVVRPPRIM